MPLFLKIKDKQETAWHCLNRGKLCKRLDNKYFRPLGYLVSLNRSSLLLQHESRLRQYTDGEAQLCANRTLFTKKQITD